MLTITQVAVGLFVQICQRLFFGPFRNIPGPWLNRVSELPAALALLKGDQHIYYKSLHDKYGPVVRVSPDEISFISVEARQEIYGLRVSYSPTSRDNELTDIPSRRVA